MSEPFPTLGGVVTRGETYAKLMHHINESQNLAAVLAHLHQTEGTDMDRLLAKGWLGVSELFRVTGKKVTALAMNKLQ